MVGEDVYSTTPILHKSSGTSSVSHSSTDLLISCEHGYHLEELPKPSPEFVARSKKPFQLSLHGRAATGVLLSY